MAWIRVDLTDNRSVEDALDDVDVLYDVAETKLNETQNIFEACVRKSVPHVVCLSSIRVYGLAAAGETIDEITPWDIHLEEPDPETRATLESEQYAAAIGRKTKLAVTMSGQESYTDRWSRYLSNDSELLRKSGKGTRPYTGPVP